MNPPIERADTYRSVSVFAVQTPLAGVLDEQILEEEVATVEGDAVPARQVTRPVPVDYAIDDGKFRKSSGANAGTFVGQCSLYGSWQCVVVFGGCLFEWRFDGDTGFIDCGFDLLSFSNGF